MDGNVVDFISLSLALPNCGTGIFVAVDQALGAAATPSAGGFTARLKSWVNVASQEALALDDEDVTVLFTREALGFQLA